MEAPLPPSVTAKKATPEDQEKLTLSPLPKRADGESSERVCQVIIKGGKKTTTSLSLLGSRYTKEAPKSFVETVKTLKNYASPRKEKKINSCVWDHKSTIRSFAANYSRQLTLD